MVEDAVNGEYCHVGRVAIFLEQLLDRHTVKSVSSRFQTSLSGTCLIFPTSMVLRSGLEGNKKAGRGPGFSVVVLLLVLAVSGGRRGGAIGRCHR